MLHSRHVAPEEELVSGRPQRSSCPPGTEDSRLNNECNNDPVCPPKCRCESGVVDCSNLKLTKVPEQIPASTTEL